MVGEIWTRRQQPLADGTVAATAEDLGLFHDRRWRIGGRDLDPAQADGTVEPRLKHPSAGLMRASLQRSVSRRRRLPNNLKEWIRKVRTMYLKTMARRLIS